MFHHMRWQFVSSKRREGAIGMSEQKLFSSDPHVDPLTCSSFHMVLAWKNLEEAHFNNKIFQTKETCRKVVHHLPLQNFNHAHSKTLKNINSRESLSSENLLMAKFFFLWVGHLNLHGNFMTPWAAADQCNMRFMKTSLLESFNH